MALLASAKLATLTEIQRAILPDVTNVVTSPRQVSFEFKFKPLRFLPHSYLVIPRTRSLGSLIVAMETQGVPVSETRGTDDLLLFQGSKTARFPPDELARLSDRMTELDTVYFKKATRSDNTAIPAGYTYLAQFLNHDVLYNTRLLGRPTDVLASRTPRLNLDSLYGETPGLYGEIPGANLDLYEAGIGGALRFRLGKTADGNDYDLPRAPHRGATIPEQRNDNNFILAQLTVLFMRFHNTLADRLNLPFERAREQVTLHYQSAILNDLLRRLLNRTVLQKVILDEAPLYGETRGAFVPYEFSNAAFRLHTMTRSRYQITRQRYLDFPEVLRLTGLGGPDLFPLDPGLVIDWSLFFPTSVEQADSLVNFSRPIDPYVTSDLLNFVLPDFDIQTQRLLKMPLGRAPTLGLVDLYTSNGIVPSAQTSLAWLRAHGYDFPPLEPLDIESGILGKLGQADFVNETPLFYYLLKEAEVLEQGQRLGPLGSMIVAETIIGLLRQDETSILRNISWKPIIPTADPKMVLMSDIASFVLRGG
ncbi:peroxidase family protein [Mesorhizobium sp.]|uniref:peroxidase family protein n=1 Tax=Mesorhizobium sp. TaxID=1871066 RepID=UPI0012200AF4|nr:peroxidase family protein [Mesorhizobium sp.]TIL65296.1 MAG: hypothetical protein E5Y77_22050 [Mesorhizobium sp.]